MGRWDSQNHYDYSDQPFRSPMESREILVGELRSLDWLPWRVSYGGVESMSIYSRPTYKQHMSSLGSTNRYSLIEAEDGSHKSSERTPGKQRPRSLMSDRVNQRLEVAKAVQNRFHYKRNLYKECGWADNFRGDEFEERRRLLEKEHYDLMLHLGRQAMRIQDIEQGGCLREWYREKAGVNAE